MKKIETKSTVLLKHHLKQLKLPTMESECEQTALRCAMENVDHLGYVPASKLFFDVISTVYERTSVIITTNLPFDQWADVLGSARLAGAVLD